MHAELIATVMLGLAVFVFKRPHASEATRCLSLSDLPLSMMPSRPIHAVTLCMFSCGQHTAAHQWPLKSLLKSTILRELDLVLIFIVIGVSYISLSSFHGKLNGPLLFNRHFRNSFAGIGSFGSVT